MLDQKRFVEAAAKVMADERDLPVYISIKDAWVLISGIQLATRHPELPERTKAHLTAIAHQFEGAIVELHPEAEELLNIGWQDKQPKKFNKNRRH